MAKLFEPITLRGLAVKNRIWIAPMCQYSAEGKDGVPTSWQMTHLVSRAVGGAGMIIVEASGVSPEGRITPWCTGIWNNQQMLAWQQIVAECKKHGAKLAMQLAHAGRKASTHRESSGTGSVALADGGWQTVSATDKPFDTLAAPKRLDESEIAQLVQDFAKAAQLSVQAGFDAVEIHGAHGYLIHQFLSPISNDRTDRYGGSFENRTRFLMELIHEIRKTIPSEMPLMLRLSATDYIPGGWDEAQTANLSALATEAGVDLIDVSSGGIATGVKIPSGAGYQVPLSEYIANRIAAPVSAVGQITTAQQAEEILSKGLVDVIMIARASLRDPYWPLRAAHELGVEVGWPEQYLRGKFPKS